MKPFLLFFLLLSLLLAAPAPAQEPTTLSLLPGHVAEIYYSQGLEGRATAIAQRVDKALAYYQQLLGFAPHVRLLVLSARDWQTHTTVPVVYGMPHYASEQTLVVAAEDNPFWQSFIPPLEQLPAGLQEQILAVYTNGEGRLSMEPFFDLLALHELGHAFHFQAGLNMQRKWMGELFTNTLLHTYIAENEPSQLQALTLFPKMVVAAGASEFTYTSLQDIEQHYEEIGQQHPKNYGWYQCRWSLTAEKIYESGGPQASKRWWEALKAHTDPLDDQQLISLLETQANKALADMIRNWERETR